MPSEICVLTSCISCASLNRTAPFFRFYRLILKGVTLKFFGGSAVSKGCLFEVKKVTLKEKNGKKKKEVFLRDRRI